MAVHQIQVVLRLTCPTCQGQQYYDGLEDAELPDELPDVNFCHHCADHEGLREVAVPARDFLRAFAPGNTDQQAYAELVGAWLSSAAPSALPIGE